MVQTDIMPNPSVDKTYIRYKLPDNSGEAELVIYNTGGSELKNCILMFDEGAIELKPGELPAGIYSVSLKVNGSVAGVKKMIILSD